MTWSMYAHDHKGEFQHLGERWWVEIHGLPDPVVAVELDEVERDDPAGTHWGWIEAGKDEPCMIWPFWGAFAAQFPYGVKAEVDRGKGRVVRLAVRKADGNGRAP